MAFPFSNARLPYKNKVASALHPKKSVPICSRRNLDYVDLSKIKDNEQYFAGKGSTVYGDDGTEHKIEHDGVAKHPGDKAMQYIAEETYKKIKDK